jgi:hypothetical protein
MKGAGQQVGAGNLKDNPRKLGKGWARLVGPTPPETGLPACLKEAGFTSSSADVRASSVYAKKELRGQERLEAAPNRVK